MSFFRTNPCNYPLYYNLPSNNPKDFKLYSGLPYPYYYPYTAAVPNLVADSTELYHNSGKCYFFYGADYDPLNGQCHDPSHGFLNSNCQYRTGEIYDYRCYYEQTPFQDPSVCQAFTVQLLISNIFDVARNFDINLLDPWGILIVNDIVWVASAGTGIIACYNLLGVPLAPAVNVFGPGNNTAAPTSIAANTTVSGFFIIDNAIRQPSTLLIATRDGTINGYNREVDLLNSFVIIDNSMKNSVYTGMALVRNILYVADFFNARIEAYRSDLKQITDFPFVDEFSTDPIPEDYAPFNIVCISDLLYVTYARQDPRDNQLVLIGKGHGYISIFSLQGIFVRRFASNGILNTPWGLALAPSSFGFPAGSIMVANYGDGTISIFDIDGNCLGNLKDANGNIIAIEGIRALTVNPCYQKLLYFSVNNYRNKINNFKAALVGTIGVHF